MISKKLPIQSLNYIDVVTFEMIDCSQAIYNSLEFSLFK